MGAIIGDLSSRRGQIVSTENRANAVIIKAEVPLVEMFGYINTLRTTSQGRGQYSMMFSQYSQVPQGIMEEIIGKQ